MTGTQATFSEMSTAIRELGMGTPQQEANAELMADRLRRWGMSEQSARFALERMRCRNEVLADAQMFFDQVARWDAEILVRELTKQDPPRWGVIWSLIRVIARTRWARLRLSVQRRMERWRSRK